MLDHRGLLAAAPCGRRHACHGDQQGEIADAELGRQPLHRIVDSERGVAGAQHQGAVAQQDVEHVREGSLFAQTYFRPKTSAVSARTRSQTATSVLRSWP